MDDTSAARVLAGYDGSLPAGAAIEAGAVLLPSAHARIAFCWTPPFASEAIRRRLRTRTIGLEDLVAAIEREGAAEAEHIAGTDVTLAQAAGWACEPVAERVYGGEGFAIADLAAKLRLPAYGGHLTPGRAVAERLAAAARERHAAVVVVGSRGRSAAREILLGSVAMATLHHAHRPVLVVHDPTREP